MASSGYTGIRGTLKAQVVTDDISSIESLARRHRLEMSSAQAEKTAVALQLRRLRARQVRRLYNHLLKTAPDSHKITRLAEVDAGFRYLDYLGWTEASDAQEKRWPAGWDVGEKGAFGTWLSVHFVHWRDEWLRTWHDGADAEEGDAKTASTREGDGAVRADEPIQSSPEPEKSDKPVSSKFATRTAVDTPTDNAGGNENERPRRACSPYWLAPPPRRRPTEPGRAIDDELRSQVPPGGKTYARPRLPLTLALPIFFLLYFLHLHGREYSQGVRPLRAVPPILPPRQDWTMRWAK
ncbi:hypothetical protein ColLi_09095 [Colletotrichum liriopes]|uniref:Uncharacterized protein n=1 Tax=Colletotrichum liriopes TaxID=708192 RepID=A0AA37GSP3_9PEZI|nr:hypothetical protein ColLi_09095 [Colletotrichum liriopes]